MASSAPPLLPITTNPSTAAGGGTTTTTTPSPTTALRGFLSNISDQVRSSLSHRRPWSELVDRTAFSKPDSISEANSRIWKNYSYFRVNYLAVVASVLVFSLLSHPASLLFLVALLAAWIFLYLFRPSDSPVVVFGRTFSDRETLGVLVVMSVVVVFLTSVGSVLISALIVGAGLVCVHGAFRVPEDLFLDEQEPASSGFLSFLGGAAKNAASVSGPAVVAAARV
ncbi:hypothetical protein Droror1_Dr00026036 [Drosera rotundifolia]